MMKILQDLHNSKERHQYANEAHCRTFEKFQKNQEAFTAKYLA